MSARLRIAEHLGRLLVKPRLARAQDPLDEREGFERQARRLFRAPPHSAFRNGRLGRVPVAWVSCGAVRSPLIVLFVHGGGFIAGSPRTHWHMAAHLAHGLRCEAVLPDYRLAPEHRFPAALDDVEAAYEALVRSGRGPETVALVGDSAGGCLVMGLLERLNRRGAPMPLAAVAISPVLDLTGSSPSVRDNARSEALLPAERFPDLRRFYLGDHPADDPEVSPLFARFARMPPTLFHACEGEILRDDTLRMQSALVAQGHEPLVRLWPSALHVFHLLCGWVPEAGEALDDIADFIRQQH